MKKETPLETIRRLLSFIHDRTREVADGEIRAAYIYGPGGTLKTVTVERTLKTLKIKYEYFAGVITEGGIRELLAECAEKNIRVIVMDDISDLFKPQNRKAVQVLNAALGGKPFSYQRAGQPRVTTTFDGGIIFISNETIPQTKSLAALKTRMRVLSYCPTNSQLAALMRDWAAREKLPASAKTLTRNECKQVVEFLIDTSKETKIRLDLRLVSKCYTDYRRWKDGKTKNHWQALVRSELEQAALSEQQKGLKPLTQAERLANELAIAEQIVSETDDCGEQYKLWAKRAPEGGESRHRFDRRKREVRAKLQKCKTAKPKTTKTTKVAKKKNDPDPVEFL